MQALLVGAGYTAQFLYKRLRENLDVVYTLSRSVDFLDNPNHICADLDVIDSLEALGEELSKISTIYYLAPPKAETLTEQRIYHFIVLLSQRVQSKIRIIYISTSGVYGHQNGAWVDETSPTKAQTDRAHRRLSAEQQLLELNQQALFDCIILRVPGIYGPGRLPLEKIKQRNKIISEEECGYTNLIHVIDLVSILIATSERGKAGEIYNVSDTRPIKSSYYYKQVAALAGLATPEEVSYAEAVNTFDHKRLSFLQESRRLKVDKLLEQVKPELLYTDLATGIEQALSKNLKP